MKIQPTCFRHRVSLIAWFACLSLTTFAQPKAAFKSNITSGCTPILVNFSDLSTGNPTQWRWNLGNGVISTLQNPSTTYFNPGIYNIKLVVRNASGSDSLVKNQFITVNANPVVRFTVSDSTGCFPLHVQFNNLSTAGSGTLSNFDWDFGDGSVSAAEDPSHDYVSSGSFTTTLRVTNSLGCSKTLSIPNYIKVSAGVTADFKNSGAGTCSLPVTVNFVNSSTGPGSLSYTWDFGDGSTAAFADPAHKYRTAGVFTVSLVAISPQGCRDTIVKRDLINIGIIKSQFVIPDSICAGKELMPANTTVPIPGLVTWDFGDGSFSTQAKPTKIYSNAGIYSIKLVNNFGGCLDSVSKSIVIKQLPVAGFSSGATTSCKVPFTVNFLGQSSGSSSWQWNFGDGTTSTKQDPVHTYTNEGSFTVTLISTNTNGCSDTIVKPDFIKIQKPVITILGLPRSGCIPLIINPTAIVTANQPITSYMWEFGDGTKAFIANPTHTYTLAGNYDVAVTITTTGGCTEKIVLTNAVKAGNKPNAAFTATPTDICAFQPVKFTDISTGNVDQWSWQFGDGGISNQQNPLYPYQDTGYFSVTLFVWSNTCPDTVVIDNIVHIKPPIASFIVDLNCSNRYRRIFVDHSIGATSWQWNFGDGGTSSLQNPFHIYALKGTYTVSLTVSNGTCTHSDKQTISIIDERADFVADNSAICKNSSINFTSVNINASNISTWSWNFGDGTSSNTIGTATHKYVTQGIYTVSLRLNDLYGCKDTISQQIKVHGPRALFTSNVPSACLGASNVLFNDASTSDGINPIVKRTWNYGDGTIDSTSPPPFTHVYTVAGTYSVSLTVTDSYGCSDNFISPAAIIIAQPKADFNSIDTNSCTNKQISFINTSTGFNLKYDWQFGDGGRSAIKDPAYQYSNIGHYPVSLHVTDQYGCKDSITRDKYIRISLPLALFTISDSLGTCPPLLVNFTNSSLNAVSQAWDFGDGNTSILPNPSHYYALPGIFFPVLTVTGPGGCTDVMSKRIEIRGPRGSFVYTPLIGCNPVTATFTATTLNRLSFIWDFGDGTTMATGDSLVTHTYISAGEYTPKMILLDGSGCSVPIEGGEIIKVVGIDAMFLADKKELCNSGNINFQNGTLSNDLITSYAWDFGDGSVSSDMQPSHQYTQPGNYKIQMSVNTETGCTASFVDSINVFQGPVIAILGDTSVCVPALINFSGQVIQGDPLLLKWKWNFGNGQVDSVQNPPSQLFTIASNYLVSSRVTDIHGCSDSILKLVSIHPLPLTNAGADVLLCKGSSIMLQASGATTYSWNASASLSCITCANPLASPADTSSFIVTGATQFGCIALDTIKVNVRKPFVLNVSPGDSLCAGESALLSATGADQYAWSPTAGLDNPRSATTKATPSTTTLFSVIAKDIDNCFTDTATILVIVSPLPVVDAGKDMTVAAGNSDQLSASGSRDITSWSWTPQYQLSCFNCPDPKVTPKQTINYSVSVKTAAGCVSKDEVNVFVTCNNGNLFIPNTFSPNGDGMNDRFYPRGTGIGLIKSFRVFNRWGELVFEAINFNANDSGKGWDGTYKGQKLPADVFIYTCEVICVNNQVLLFKGDVTLLQ